VKLGSCLYVGSVIHRRFRPRIHWFRYRAFWLLVDLAELGAISRRLRFFSLDRFNLFGFSNADHGDGSRTPVRSQVMQHLRRAGIDLENGTIRLLCMPRVLGYCFNPLSVYFCHHSDGRLAAMLYEVHNTFGQRHSYLIPTTSDAATIHQRCGKEFYVSPFMDMEMLYDFSIRIPSKRTAVSIRASQGGQPVMTACLAGERKPLTDRALMNVFLAIPVLTLKVTVAIHWQALCLWLKGLRLRPLVPPRPAGSVPMIAERLD
jgi:DUF1365 family protein